MLLLHPNCEKRHSTSATLFDVSWSDFWHSCQSSVNTGWQIHNSVKLQQCRHISDGSNQKPCDGWQWGLLAAGVVVEVVWLPKEAAASSIIPFLKKSRKSGLNCQNARTIIPSEITICWIVIWDIILCCYSQNPKNICFALQLLVRSHHHQQQTLCHTAHSTIGSFNQSGNFFPFAK